MMLVRMTAIVAVDAYCFAVAVAAADAAAAAAVGSPKSHG